MGRLGGCGQEVSDARRWMLDVVLALVSDAIRLCYYAGKDGAWVGSAGNEVIEVRHDIGVGDASQRPPRRGRDDPARFGKRETLLVRVLLLEHDTRPVLMRIFTSIQSDRFADVAVVELDAAFHLVERFGSRRGRRSPGPDRVMPGFTLWRSM